MIFADCNESLTDTSTAPVFILAPVMRRVNFIVACCGRDLALRFWLALAMVFALTGTALAEGPSIASVSAIMPQQSQTITINGSGFGSQAAYTGDTAYIRITDITRNWNAGWTGNDPADFVTLSISSWNDSQIVVSGFTGDYGSYNWTLNVGDQVTVSVWNPQSGVGPTSCLMTVGASSGTNCGASKAIGDCGCTGAGQPQVSEPVTVGTGNMFEQITDYATHGANPLAFTRYYNSQSNLVNATFAVSLGVNWRTNYDRYLLLSQLSVVAERADGQQVTFNLKAGVWTPDSDIDETLTQSGSTWTLTDSQDTAETYTAISTSEARLTSIKARNGYTQTLVYNGSNQLTKITDSYDRVLMFTYTGGLLDTVSTPDGTTLTYAFEVSGVTPGKLDRLASVAYATTPATSQSYLYENSTLPFALTGIQDEDGNRYATWAYDSSTRATSAQLGAGANLTTFVYNSDGSTTVTNALGVADTYAFATLQGVPKVTSISRAATSSTAVATETFTYDANGYTATKTDWNGNQTAYVNNSHGLPTTINEAVGASAARTTTIAYDSNWIHLPASIATSGVTTTFTYDGSGEQLTKTLTDTTTTTKPYSTAGQVRTWTNTWSNSLLASTQTPNGNTTKFGYDSAGALTSVTDPLGHVTNITSNSGGGLPLVIVDPNGVTTTLAYDARQRLTSSQVSGTTGTYTTTWAYDPAGNLITTTLPDNSFLTNVYDSAHRLTQTTDALGNYISYTLDALGDRTQTNVNAKDGTLTWERSGTFDALGRMLVDTGGAGQTTTRTFDPNGNVLSVEDGLSHTTTNTYDALNRLSASTDANTGVTTPAYDTHNRITSVTDANGNTTFYQRNGFGDVIQQTSPDSGVSVFQYDADANLTSKTDALGIVTNQTFDALDRPLTTTYPAHTVENVAYTYDQTGTGFSFGIGRLTSVTDAAGALTRTYEERGNLLSEIRVNGVTTLTTGYTYDGANRVASMTYPDGSLVTYQHDAAGYVSSVTATLPGSASATPIATVTHQPFGPLNGVTYGNGIAETWAFDKAYRPSTIVDALSGTNLQNLAYAYDVADNVKSITDAVNAANSQTLGYDVINRLTSATSGTGGYGSLAWTYDKVGNRLTQAAGPTTTTYGYTTGTNQLATITTTVTPQSQVKYSSILGRPRPGTVRPPANRDPEIPANKATQPPSPIRPASPKAAGLWGWPLLLGGMAGILGFRRRLFSHRLLGVVMIVATLAGGAAVLNGCGGGQSATPMMTVAATPTFSPSPGTYTAAQTVTLSDATSGATIYYTTNGTMPTANSTQYTAPLTVSATETIEAIATANRSTSSAVATATYTINLPVTTVATPTFSPAAATYSAAQTVTISDSTAGAAIYFTTNGSTPTANSTPYTGPIVVSSTQTLKAIATASGSANSAVATATYTINIPVPTAATPTFSPTAGTYSSPQTVTIADATPGAAIYFTTDGTTPTTSSAQYTAPITVGSSETLQAIAAASGFTNSAVASAAYTITIPVVATPTFSPGTGTYTSAQTVTISDATAGASIYFTTDGTTPTASSTQYSAPITVSSSETLKAIATAAGDTSSSVGSATYTINGPDVVTVITNANGNITSIPPANSTANATFTYNNANRLASAIGSPMAATFVYDWQGQRYSKTDGGVPPTVYSYAQGNTLIAENDNGSVTDYIYVDGRPIATLQPSVTPAANQVDYVLADRLGTPQIARNSEGVAVWGANSQPFGTPGLITASITQNLRLPGQYADAETGFNYNGQRDYMPNLGRYLESDPYGVAGGINLYSYARENPLLATDRTGLCPQCEAVAVEAGIVEQGGFALAWAFPEEAATVGDTLLSASEQLNAGLNYSIVAAQNYISRSRALTILSSLGLGYFGNSAVNYTPGPSPSTFSEEIQIFANSQTISGIGQIINVIQSQVDNLFTLYPNLFANQKQSVDSSSGLLDGCDFGDPELPWPEVI